MAWKLSKKTQKEFDKLNDRIKELENNIQDINIQYKYALFDAEATRREMIYLRKFLEENNGL